MKVYVYSISESSLPFHLLLRSIEATSRPLCENFSLQDQESEPGHAASHPPGQQLCLVYTYIQPLTLPLLFQN